MDQSVQHNDITSPARTAVAITPSNTANLAVACRTIYVGVGGDITAVMLDDSVVLFTAVNGGIFPISVKRVNATGTTATNMVALY